jgi:hypothetical protein
MYNRSCVGGDKQLLWLVETSGSPLNIWFMGVVVTAAPVPRFLNALIWVELVNWVLGHQQIEFDCGTLILNYPL